MMRILTTLFLLVLAASASHAAPREEAIRSHCDRIRKGFGELPDEYQKSHKSELENYLLLFTTANDITWNQKWPKFVSSMGPEFVPYHSAVIEAMKVAEAYQACYPSPQKRMPSIANVVFAESPTNAILFVHGDVFETILLVEQEVAKTRPDITVINSSRLMDQTYIGILKDRHPGLFNSEATEISKRVFLEALRKKEGGDREFDSIMVVDGKVKASGVQLICSLSVLMMKDICREHADRPVVIMPAVHEYWTPIQAWQHLSPIGLFNTWSERKTEGSQPDYMAAWQNLINAAAPQNEPLQARMANAIGKTINAAVFIHQGSGNPDLAGALTRMWERRVKSLRIVEGDTISIDVQGRMVEQAESTVPVKAAPSAPSTGR